MSGPTFTVENITELYCVLCFFVVELLVSQFNWTLQMYSSGIYIVRNS